MCGSAPNLFISTCLRVCLLAMHWPSSHNPWQINCPGVPITWPPRSPDFTRNFSEGYRLGQASGSSLSGTHAISTISRKYLCHQWKFMAIATALIMTMVRISYGRSHPFLCTYRNLKLRTLEIRSWNPRFWIGLCLRILQSMFPKWCHVEPRGSTKWK
jgi:hypothetical protein